VSTTVTTTTSATDTATAPTIGSVLLTGAVATVAAAVATAAVAVAGQAVGIGTAMSGQTIPAAGFAFLTAIFSVVGLVIAVSLRRFARRPRTMWIRTTVALTVLSFVPDVLADATVGTKLLLMLTHVVAAAIVIPAIARRLS
jgi:predicted alpha/beta hydrolase